MAHKLLSENMKGKDQSGHLSADVKDNAEIDLTETGCGGVD
jgi:hypothetical protein